MKLLFDENFGRPLVSALKGLLAFSRDCPEVRHILELQTAGKKDPDWVPQLASNGWVILTCDRGKSAGPKLPQLCRAYRITHVLISGGLHNSPQFEKARAVLVV
jgi:PIN like domain